MTQRKHGVTTNRKASSLSPAKPEPTVRTITVSGVGSAGYTRRELDLVDDLKAAAPPTLLNELEVLHTLKARLGATLQPPGQQAGETTERQEALF